MKKILIVCISDCYGRELKTAPLDIINLDSVTQIEHEEDNVACETGECCCHEYMDIASIYSVPTDAWNNRYETNYADAHSSHWLSEHGNELCLGDYV